MTFEPDISEDALLVDGIETVTLQGASTVTVEGAKRGLLTLAETQSSQVGLSADDIAWMLPAVNIADAQPRSGDSLTDAAGEVWVVVAATKSTLTEVWRVIARKQR